jgi:hypothetical protein
MGTRFDGTGSGLLCWRASVCVHRVALGQRLRADPNPRCCRHCGRRIVIRRAFCAAAVQQNAFSLVGQVVRGFCCKGKAKATCERRPHDDTSSRSAWHGRTSPDEARRSGERRPDAPCRRRRSAACTTRRAVGAASAPLLRRHATIGRGGTRRPRGGPVLAGAPCGRRATGGACRCAERDGRMTVGAECGRLTGVAAAKTARGISVHSRSTVRFCSRTPSR